MVTALGLAACRHGKRVRFMTVADLAEAQVEHRLSRFAAQVDRVHLLILDELRFVKLNSDQAQLLFTLLAHRYIRGGLIVTSNLNFDDWTAVFNDDVRLTAALLDRITHRCHLLEFNGESYRFRQSLAAREGKLPPQPAPVSPPPRNADNNRDGIQNYGKHGGQGSGAIEKTIDIAIGRRLKHQRMSWYRPGAHHILARRTLKENRTWNRYWAARRSLASLGRGSGRLMPNRWMLPLVQLHLGRLR